MFIFTIVGGLLIVSLVQWYSRFIRQFFLDPDDEEVSYNKHPMSESEDDDDDDDYEDDGMDDFYEESYFPPGWFLKTEEEKRKILDKELEEYMSQKMKTN